MVKSFAMDNKEYIAWCQYDDEACDFEACYHVVNGRISPPFCPRYDADFDKLIRRLFGKDYWKELRSSDVSEVDYKK